MLEIIFVMIFSMIFIENHKIPGFYQFFQVCCHFSRFPGRLETLNIMDFRRAIFSANIILQILHGDQRKKVENAERKTEIQQISGLTKHRNMLTNISVYMHISCTEFKITLEDLAPRLPNALTFWNSNTTLLRSMLNQYLHMVHTLSFI